MKTKEDMHAQVFRLENNYSKNAHLYKDLLNKKTKALDSVHQYLIDSIENMSSSINDSPKRNQRNLRNGIIEIYKETPKPTGIQVGMLPQISNVNTNKRASINFGK